MFSRLSFSRNTSAPRAGRRILLCLASAALVSVSCASRGSEEPIAVRDADGYQARTASALVYAPPALEEEVDRYALDAALARHGRGESAVLGYDTPTVVTYYQRVEDEQGVWGLGFGRGVHFDDYERRAISTRSFMRIR